MQLNWYRELDEKLRGNIDAMMISRSRLMKDDG